MDIGSKGIDGPAEDVYRVTPMDRDSGRNHRQQFADFSEPEEQQEDRPGGSGPGAGKQKPIVDDLLLSEVAKQSIEGQAQDAGPAVAQDADLKTKYDHPGSVIDLTA